VGQPARRQGEEVRFAEDSPVEGDGFEPSVPPVGDSILRDHPGNPTTANLYAAAAGLGTLFMPHQNSVLTFGKFEHDTHLFRGKLVVSQALARYNPEEIADLLVTADRRASGCARAQ
jgi:hypothetical protein